MDTGTGYAMCITVNRELNRDPTQTISLRMQFEGDASRRFRNIKGQIRDVLIDADALGLRTNRDSAGVSDRAFDFPRSADKVEAFMAWLKKATNSEILEVTEGVPLSQAANRAWMNTYIRRSYRKGVTHAATRMRKAGATVGERWIDAAFNRPIHADRLGLIFTRTFSELEGITQTMDSQISRVLAQGIGEGIGPLDMARQINERVDKIGITRARVLARSETISSHAEASLNSYAEAGVEGVNIKAEFSTAGDSRVCPECEVLEGDEYSIEDARGVIPVHPNCFEVGTQVSTVAGWRAIEDVLVGEHVWSIDPETLAVEAKPVTNTIRGESDEMIRFGSVVVTPDHEMLVARDGKLERMPAKKVPYQAKMRFSGNAADSVAVYPKLERRHVQVACIEVADYHTLLVKNDNGAMWCGNCRCSFIPAVQDLRGTTLQ